MLSALLMLSLDRALRRVQDFFGISLARSQEGMPIVEVRRFRDDFLDRTFRLLRMDRNARLDTHSDGSASRRTVCAVAVVRRQCGKPGACGSEPGCVHVHERPRLPEPVHVPRHQAELHGVRDLAVDRPRNGGVLGRRRRQECRRQPRYLEQPPHAATPVPMVRARSFGTSRTSMRRSALDSAAACRSRRPTPRTRARTARSAP